MKFETVPTDGAEGTILVHALRLPNLVIPKGRRLESIQLAQLEAAGIERIAVALIEAGDVPEDCAANRVARNLVGSGVFAKNATKGRVNIYSVASGIISFDPQCINRLNHIDEAITIATVPLHDLVGPNQIVATIKVNPYAVSEQIVSSWEEAATTFKVERFRPHRASLIQTLSPGLKDSVLGKTMRNTRDRLESLGSSLSAAVRTPHSTEALSTEILTRLRAGDELILICGASSIADRRDVIPSAIIQAGGRVEHFGMPVDPGNLLLVGAVGDVAVLGMPGCARSPQLNGFDYVLRLLLAGLPVGREQIMAMGVGGLLRDIPWRSALCVAANPNSTLASKEVSASPRIAAIILAAGQSSRMGANKLTLSLHGKPVLAHVVDKVRASGVALIVVVLGHDAEAVRSLFNDADIHFVINERHREGLSTSLKSGLSSLPPDVDGALIFLGDMPDIDVGLPDRMIGAFNPQEKRAIVIPKHEGRRGHPILWGRDFFPMLLEKLNGDSGARHLIDECSAWVAEIDTDHNGIFADLDTPEEFASRSDEKCDHQ